MRVAIWVVPILAGFVAASFVARALPQPTTAYEIVFWWAAIIAVATVTSTAVDRFARRLLPLTVLLKMTMLFPDAAPSRLRMARRAGNVSELRRRIHEAQTGTGDPDLAEMAELILSLSAALSNHDRKTRGHSERTRAYTDMIAEEMGLPEADRDRLRWAALLHDVGKLEVPAEVLNKESKLTSDEWELVKQHPINGMKLIGPLVPWLGTWAKTIEHHHERYDGTGYPHGLAGEEISLGARIVSVADAYDVMTSGRAYQRAKTPAEARREIATMAGQQFDPVVARALMNVSLGKLRWSTGPIAVLAEIPFIRGLPQVGRDVAMVMTTSAVMTTGFVTGAVPLPEGQNVTPSQVVEVVIAGAGLRQDPDLPTDTPDDLPLAAPGATFADGGSDDGGGTADPAEGDEDGESPSTPDTTTATTSPPTAPPGTDAPTTTPPPPPGTDPPTTTTTAPPSNLPPRAVDDTAGTDEDVAVTVGVLGNDSDPDGNLDPSTLAIAGGPTKGSASVSGSSIRYTPTANTHGSDAFTYRICDAAGACSTARVAIAVTPVNDPPVAPARSATTDAGTFVSVPLGYSDPDGDPLSCVLAAPPAVGAATVPSNCSALGYSPPSSHDGVVTIRVTVSDGTATVTGTVTIEVIGTNGPPVANPDSASSDGSPVTIAVLANDTDPDGDPLSIGSAGSATGGTVAVSGSSVVFTPTPGFSGTGRFTYTACDDGGLCDSANVTITVSPAAAPVVANDDATTVKKNGKVNISVLGNDTGPIDPASVSVGGATGGTVSIIGGSGRIRFDAAPGFTGTATFSYTVCSAAGACDSAIVRVEVS